MARRKRNDLAPFSVALSPLDGRTRAARLLKETRAALVAMVGGKPTPNQALLIETAAQLKLRLALMDRAFSRSGQQTGHDTRTYLAWSNSFRRAVARLGVPDAPPKADPLAAYKAFMEERASRQPPAP